MLSTMENKPGKLRMMFDDDDQVGGGPPNPELEATVDAWNTSLDLLHGTAPSRVGARRRRTLRRKLRARKPKTRRV